METRHGKRARIERKEELNKKPRIVTVEPIVEMFQSWGKSLCRSHLWAPQNRDDPNDKGGLIWQFYMASFTPEDGLRQWHILYGTNLDRLVTELRAWVGTDIRTGERLSLEWFLNVRICRVYLTLVGRP